MHSTIVAGDNMQIVCDGYLMIEGSKIVSLGSGQPPTSEPTIDGSNLIIIPGLIDAHTHIADSIAKEVGINLGLMELMNPPNGLKHRLLNSAPESALIEGMRNTMKEMISCGTVAFGDYREGGQNGVKQLRKASENLAVRAVIMGRLAKKPFSDEELEINTKQLSRDELEEAERVLAVADGFSTVDANDFTDPAYAQVRELTERLGKIRTTHSSEIALISEKTMRTRGMTDIEKIIPSFSPNFVVHMANPIKESDIDLLATSRVSVVCCPRANCRLGDGFPPILEMYRKGIMIALGTDNMILNSPDLFEEMEFTSKSVSGIHRSPGILPPTEIFKMATINGARVLALDREIGSIQVGKNATLVFIKTDTIHLSPISADVISSIVNRAKRFDITAVMIDGQIVYGNLGG